MQTLELESARYQKEYDSLNTKLLEDTKDYEEIWKEFKAIYKKLRGEDFKPFAVAVEPKAAKKKKAAAKSTGGKDGEFSAPAVALEQAKQKKGRKRKELDAQNPPLESPKKKANKPLTLNSDDLLEMETENDSERDSFVFGGKQHLSDTEREEVVKIQHYFFSKHGNLEQKYKFCLTEKEMMTQAKAELERNRPTCYLDVKLDEKIRETRFDDSPKWKGKKHSNFRYQKFLTALKRLFLVGRSCMLFRLRKRRTRDPLRTLSQSVGSVKSLQRVRIYEEQRSRFRMKRTYKRPKSCSQLSGRK